MAEAKVIDFTSTMSKYRKRKNTEQERMEGGKEKLARRIRGMWLWTFEILQALT